MKELPEFSQRNYNFAGYIVGTAITCSGVLLIYQILFHADITFSANWNMFDSVLMWPLYIIGLLVMFANWNTFSFSYDTYDKITYGDGHTEVKRNWDIIEWMMGHVIAPVLGRFVLVPIIIAALIYYPLMCIVHLVGSIFPYILSLIVVAIIGFSWMFTRWFQFRYHSWVLVLVGIVFTAAFSWGGYAISHTEEGGTIQMIADMTQQGGSSDEFSEGGSSAASSDDVFGDSETSSTSETDEFDDEPCDGLYSQLPEGTTEFEGDMAGFPIEMTITKNSEKGTIDATYKNVKYGTTMELTGESLPAMDCNINFFGKADGQDWTFYLGGTLDQVTGTAQGGDGKELKVNLHKKVENDNEFD